MTLKAEITADVADVKAWLDGVETWAEGLGLKIVIAAWTIAKGLAPTLLVEAQGLVVGALKALGSGATLDQVIEAVYAGASADLKTAFATLTAQDIAALIALIQAL